MNERIADLYEKASEWALESDSPKSYKDRVMIKFAELIVKECMACSIWVGKINTNSVEPIHTAHAINQRIKQHFGVEE